jgi:hypothetical protein
MQMQMQMDADVRGIIYALIHCTVSAMSALALVSGSASSRMRQGLSHRNQDDDACCSPVRGHHLVRPLIREAVSPLSASCPPSQTWICS